MADKKYPKPVYEVIADERLLYNVTFGPDQRQSRQKEVADFIAQKFSTVVDIRMRMLRPNEYKDLPEPPVTILGESDGRQEI